MAINRVDYGDNTLIDLTNDTVTPQTLAQGYTAHGADGNIVNGTAIFGSGGGVTSWNDLTDRPFYSEIVGGEEVVHELNEKYLPDSVDKYYRLYIKTTSAQLTSMIAGTPFIYGLDADIVQTAMVAIYSGKEICVRLYLTDTGTGFRIPITLYDTSEICGSTEFKTSLAGTEKDFKLFVNFEPSEASIVFTMQEVNSGSSESDILWVDGTISLANLTATVDKTFAEISRALQNDKDVKLRLVSGSETDFGHLVSATSSGVVFNTTFALGTILMSVTITVTSNDTVVVGTIQIQST